jgi:hypothetical protein
MTKLELLAALKSMTVSEQLEVLEATSKNIREGLNHKTDLEIAAEKMQEYYAEGSDLAVSLMIILKIYMNIQSIFRNQMCVLYRSI